MLTLILLACKFGREALGGPSALRSRVAALQQAVAQGDEAAVQELLESFKGGGRWQQLDRAGRRGLTALHRAALAGHVGILRALLAAGASLEVVSARAGMVDFRPSLRRQGAALEQLRLLLPRALCPGSRVTALHLAAFQGNVPTIQALLAAGCSPDCADAAGSTPLHYAVVAGHDLALQELLAGGANPNTVSAAWATPLHAAVALRRAPAVRQLLRQAGVRINHGCGFPMLHATASKGMLEIARLLLAARLGPDPLDRTGATPLHVAITAGQPEVAVALLEAGADPNRPWADGSQRAALHLAVETGSFPLVVTLLAVHASPNCRDAQLRTPLLLAALRGSLQLVQALLAGGADPRLGDRPTSTTPLHATVAAGHGPEIAQALLEASQACVNASNSAGQAALHLAAEAGRVDLVSLLLQHGADPNLEDGQRHTAHYLAAARQHKEVVDVLLRAHWEAELAAGRSAEQALETLQGLRKAAGAAPPQEGGGNTECVVCLSEPRQVALSPCGHRCACVECAARLTRCPVCRQPVLRCMRIYDP